MKAAGSTFGTHFRVTTYGESHGGGVGCVIDGVPPRRPILEADLQVDLDRRYLKSVFIFFMFILKFEAELAVCLNLELISV